VSLAVVRDNAKPEPSGEENAGATAVSRRGTKPAPSCRYIVDVDVEVATGRPAPRRCTRKNASPFSGPASRTLRTTPS